MQSGPVFPVEVSASSIHLCLDRKLGCQKALRLVLGSVGSIDDVADKLTTKRKCQIVAVDVPGLILIDDKQIVALLAHGNIGVFSDFDIALRTEDEEPSVAPRAQTEGRKPIEAHVTEAVVPTQHHVAKILKL